MRSTMVKQPTLQANKQITKWIPGRIRSPVLFEEKSFSSNHMHSLPAAKKSTYNIYHEYNANCESKCYLFKLSPR